jgi:hypothetical protein
VRQVSARGARLAILAASVALWSPACAGRSTLGVSLSDQEFWRLIDSLSEPAGTFTLSDNFVSNEPRVAENVRWLRRAGGVYVGVGPEQNFSYIAQVRPRMAFIVDIRRENRNLHLLYKTLFELSNDRAEFVSQLFSRPRPPDLSTSAGVNAIFSSFESVPASRELLAATLAAVRGRLTAHDFPLTDEDYAGIRRALEAFYRDGPGIHFWGSRPVDPETVRPSYRQLMTGIDMSGRRRSFLSSENAFRFVKELQAANLLVPLVGDFGGPTTLRRVGDYVREHGDAVAAFYASNVGVYLSNEKTRAFCRNLATLPVTRNAPFIESNGVRPLAERLNACGPEPM